MSLCDRCGEELSTAEDYAYRMLGRKDRICNVCLKAMSVIYAGVGAKRGNRAQRRREARRARI